MRTRLWVFSDLHLETEGEVDILRGAPTSFDAIVVAGDVDTPSCRALFWLAERFQGGPDGLRPGQSRPMVREARACQP